VKTILIEDIERPKNRDLSARFESPLPRQSMSGVADTRLVEPLYRSTRLGLTYNERYQNTNLLIYAQAREALPTGAFRIYGWRPQQNTSIMKSTLQYKRYQGYDWIEVEPQKLGNGGLENVYAISIVHQWSWLQIACFSQLLSFGLYMSPSAVTNLIEPDDPYLEYEAPEPFIIDDFEA
jgi:hypothetical protein